MEEQWYKQMGFEKNPFSIKPIDFKDKLIGNDETINEILQKISLGKIIFIDGDYGTGKTTILKAIINKFGGNKQVVYYNCNITDNSIDFDKILKERYNWLLRLFGAKGKDMILLLDEIQDLSEEDSKKIIELKEKNSFKSIIFVGKKKDTKFSEEIKELIKENTYATKTLTNEQAIDLIKTRIGETMFLSNEAIESIYEKSNENPRELLTNCEDVCRYAKENNLELIDKKFVKSVLK